MLFKNIFVYIITNLALQLVGMVTSFSIRRFIAPADFGIWVTINVIMSYCTYSNLGMFGVIYKEIPYYLGKKDHKTVGEIKNLSSTFIILIGMLVLCGLLITALVMKAPQGFRIGLATIGVMFLLTSAYNYYLTLYRCYGSFVALSKIMLVNSLLTCVVFSAFSFLWHLYGLYVAALVTLCIIIFYVVVKGKEIVRFKFVTNWAEFKKIGPLLKTGIKLSIVGLFYTVFITVDKWLIVKKLGFESMGHYSIAMMFFEGITQVPQLMNHVIFAKMQNLSGEFGETVDFRKNAQKYLSQLTLYIAISIPIVIGMIYIWGGWVIEGIIPKYMPGLECMYILLIGGMFLGLSQFSNSFMWTLNKYLLTIPMMIIGSLSIFLISLFSIHKGFGIQGVAIATSVGYFLFFIMVSWFALSKIHTKKEIIMLYCKMLSAWLYYAALLFVALRIKFNTIPFTVFVQTVFFLAGSSPFLIRLNKKFDLIGSLRGYFKKGAPVAKK